MLLLNNEVRKDLKSSSASFPNSCVASLMAQAYLHFSLDV